MLCPCNLTSQQRLIFDILTSWKIVSSWLSECYVKLAIHSLVSFTGGVEVSESLAFDSHTDFNSLELSSSAMTFKFIYILTILKHMFSSAPSIWLPVFYLLRPLECLMGIKLHSSFGNKTSLEQMRWRVLSSFKWRLIWIFADIF